MPMEKVFGSGVSAELLSVAIALWQARNPYHSTGSISTVVVIPKNNSTNAREDAKL